MIPDEAVEAADDGGMGMNRHQHEKWQLRPDGRGGVYCAACSCPVNSPLFWGVRDRDSTFSRIVAVHPSRESAEGVADAAPEHYELVCTPYPADPKQRWYGHGDD